MFKKTLQNRLNFLVLSCIVFFGAVACSAVFFYGRYTLVENKRQDLSSLTVVQAHDINQIFLFNEKIAKKISAQSSIIDYLNSPQKIQDESVLSIIKNYLFTDQYLAIYLLDNQGVARVSTDERFLNQNYSFRNYFKNSIKGISFLEANVGTTSGELGYYFSVPVQNLDKITIGVLVLKLDPKVIEKNIVINSNETEDILLVNGEGVILFSNKKDRQFRSLGEQSPEAKQKIIEAKKFPNLEISPLSYSLAQNYVEQGKKSFTINFFDTLDNEKEFISGSRIGDTTFYLILEVSSEKMTAQALVASFVLFGFVLIAVLLCAFVIIFVLSSSFRPLKKLKIVAQAISLGDFSKKVEIKTGDELEDLGNSVNLMIDNLRDSYTNLEKKVSSKTKELADQLLKVSEKNRILGETQKAVVNVLEDIQEEKNYSQSLAKDLLKFQLAVENASDHIIIADPDAKILFANKAAQKITGFNFEEMKNNTPSLWGKQMTAEFYKNFWHVIKEEKKQFDGEIINKRKNGESYVAEIHVVPILKDNGDVQFFVGIERDITKAKEVDKSKTEFVSLASHQLRTPLTAISWYIEMLMNGKAGKLKPEQLKYLDEVYKGGQRMRDLVNALLNVSRIDLGTFAIDPEEVDIKEICDSVIAEMEPTILNKKLKVTKKYIEVPAKFVADQKLFRIILQNLISNAVKYTPPKGKVEIKMEKNKKDLLITVADSGYGIPLNQQEKIFSKLFRADNAKIKDPDGTGLGLYIIKSILDHSGGKTWFESEENKGSKFFVSLPLSGMSKKEGVKGLV